MNEVVSFSTGTKCVNENKLQNSTIDCRAESLQNSIIIDCHAESLLKRSFKRFLISRIKEKKLQLNHFTVNLFISQVPCGVIQRWKGADDKNPLESYACKGIHRKPGRGSLCPKPSCINKIAKWNLLGIQGKQLIGFTKRPIYIENIIIGNCGQEEEYDEHYLKESLRCDFHNECKVFTNLFTLNRLPKLMFCKDFRKDILVRSLSKRPSPTSIVSWIEGLIKFLHYN